MRFVHIFQRYLAIHNIYILYTGMFWLFFFYFFHLHTPLPAKQLSIGSRDKVFWWGLISWVHFRPYSFVGNLVSPSTLDQSASCAESLPHRFGGVAPLDPLSVLGVTCVWGVGAAVFAVSWLSYVHPAVLAESLTAVWQLRQGATWERTGRHDDENFNLNSYIFAGCCLKDQWDI